MKTTMILLINAVLLLGIHAQSNYEKAMKACMDSLQNINEIEDFQQTANQFERIAKQETDKWLPAYYVSYCYTLLSFKTKEIEDKESYLKVADQYIQQALTLAPEESELYALQGMYYQAIISLDPQNNGQTYSQMAEESFAKALEFNESNPRVYLLKGWNIMYTPEAYGGGMKNACPMFQQAKTLYDSEEISQTFMPQWGKDMVEGMLSQCTSE